jgi:hypothetical protein
MRTSVRMRVWGWKGSFSFQNLIRIFRIPSHMKEYSFISKSWPNYTIRLHSSSQTEQAEMILWVSFPGIYIFFASFNLSNKSRTFSNNLFHSPRDWKSSQINDTILKWKMFISFLLTFFLEYIYVYKHTFIAMKNMTTDDEEIFFCLTYHRLILIFVVCGGIGLFA